MKVTKMKNARKIENPMGNGKMNVFLYTGSAG
jgi:hypothetical protein